MRIRAFAAAAAAAGLVMTLPGSALAQPSLSDQVAGLEVAAERPAGYDRDALNINYNRDAVLERNQAAFPSCDGYLSRYDAECYSSEDEVQIDHLVAVKEAWDSGLRGDEAWEAFDGDAANLAVMTSALNGAKSDLDAAEWLPPHGPSVCHYVTTYVAVKAEYDLAVNQAEKQALVELAAKCDGGGPKSPEKPEVPQPPKGDRPDDGGSKKPPEAPQPEPVENDLAVTG